jgi:RsiW-degrading membrane proteinase PrsW (M82 family)
MNPPLSFLERAKQGDLEAIAILLQDLCKPYGLTVKVANYACLQFHSVLAGIVGYFMGLAAINPSRQVPIIFIGIAIAAVLHGLYDTFAGGVIGFAILAFTILLFVVYTRRSQQMITDMQQAEQRYRSTQL